MLRYPHQFIALSSALSSALCNRLAAIGSAHEAGHAANGACERGVQYGAEFSCVWHAFSLMQPVTVSLPIPVAQIHLVCNAQLTLLFFSLLFRCWQCFSPPAAPGSSFPFRPGQGFRYLPRAPLAACRCCAAWLCLRWLRVGFGVRLFGVRVGGRVVGVLTVCVLLGCPSPCPHVCANKLLPCCAGVLRLCGSAGFIEPSAFKLHLSRASLRLI